MYELRQYALKVGRRDALISLFERQLIEPQESVGAMVVGYFRDLDEPDHFVWVRGFDNMRSRKLALAAFYEGEVWARYRTEANATMVDSDNVLLLRPALAGSGFQLVPRTEPPKLRSDDVIVAGVHALRTDPAESELHDIARELRQEVTSFGGSLLATLITEPSVNDYPRLPVREGENVLVWFGRFSDRDLPESVVGGLKTLSTQCDAVQSKPSQLLRLAPAARSRIV